MFSCLLWFCCMLMYALVVWKTGHNEFWNMRLTGEVIETNVEVLFYLVFSNFIVELLLLCIAVWCANPLNCFVVFLGLH